MVLGLGVDIVQNDRIGKIIDRWGERFLTKVFTSMEIDFIDKRSQKIQRYAANYAVKEAMVKALGTGFRNGINFHSIQVRHNELGKPWAELHGATRSLARQIGVDKIHTSISHEKNYSVAVILLEGT